MAESNEFQISETTMIVELQHECAFLRNRVLVLSETLRQSDDEVTQLTTLLKDTAAVMTEVVEPTGQEEVSE